MYVWLKTLKRNISYGINKFMYTVLFIIIQWLNNSRSKSKNIMICSGSYWTD